MASVVWDVDCILMVDYYQKGQTIIGTNYASLLRQLREIIKVKRRRKLSKIVLFHQDNARLTRLSLLWLPAMIVALNWFNSPLTRLISLQQTSSYSKLKRQFPIPLYSLTITHAVENFLDSQEKDSLKVALRPFNICCKSQYTLIGIMIKIMYYVSQKSNLHTWCLSSFVHTPNFLKVVVHVIIIDQWFQTVR